MDPLAGIIGPALVSNMRETAIAAGVPRASVYDVTLYLLAGLLVIGLIRQPAGTAGARSLVHVA
jgi:hypothetical protein